MHQNRAAGATFPQSAVKSHLSRVPNTIPFCLRTFGHLILAVVRQGFCNLGP